MLVSLEIKVSNTESSLHVQLSVLDTLISNDTSILQWHRSKLKGKTKASRAKQGLHSHLRSPQHFERRSS
ncbi:hypothetical protein PsorP6_001382 [Peronosclerospora sorghi]|uniref:Uncharacterized protein n=1 Tax=Peronosclerospora sorghi TaxID=230839 RepID=A0ACC0WR70_9STRA|nr:hypothetical protein PsorP6_001382 [Peronosclerospora sorghi]